MKRIAIVGGGISGLSAAFALEKHQLAGASLEYVLFESSPRLGGVLVTERADGCLVEAGPDSFLTEKPWASDLCREVGLGDQLIGSNDADRKTYIVVKGRLVAAIPDGLMFMVLTKITPNRIVAAVFSQHQTADGARSGFILHDGPARMRPSLLSSSVITAPEMVDRLADPLLSGVYGGEASQLSLQAVLPRFAEMEASHGSLGRAMLAARRKMAPASKSPTRPLFTSLKDGMQQLVDAIVSRLPASALHTQPLSAADSKTRQRLGGFRGLRASDQFDALIMATPARMAAELSQGMASPELASELRGIQYTSSITVNLGYDQRVRASLPAGFGFLVPRSEGKRMLAATFVHNKFPHRAPDNRALLRCFIGGAHNQQVLQARDEEVVSVVRQELRQIIKLTADPLFTRVYRWKDVMAQYGVGHLDRLQRIENLLQQLPGLALAGNGYRGIGVPDCIRSGDRSREPSLARARIARRRTPQGAS